MTRSRVRFVAPLLAAGLVVVAAACDSGEGAPGGGGDVDFPRNETVFSTGTEWGTFANWNPIQTGGQATYVRMGIYETLFVFDPWTRTMEPWLAETGEWSGDEYVITLRDGVTWHDGEPFTADDVKFTLDLRNEEGVRYSILTEWVDEVIVEDELTVRVTFTEPRGGEWDNNLYNIHMVPEHKWSELVGGDILSVSGDDRVVGTGMLRYHSHDEERARYERNDEWWATEHLGIQMTPKYIIDFKNQSNEVVVPQLQTGDIDISNNFIAGIQQQPGFGTDISTFYAGDPYMIPANTTYLIPNHDRSPMDDPALRRALAFSVDVQSIVDNVYQNIVQPTHPSGMLPLWEEYYDDAVTAEHGFGYDLAEARSILATAGYVDLDGDGFVETPEGEPFELTLIVPAGWTDWNEASEIIAGGARDAGINVVTDFPAQPELDDLRDAGEFDLVINNEIGISNTPAEHMQYLFRLPIQDRQEARENIARYDNPEAWEKTQELWTHSLGDEASAGDITRLVSELQEIAMAEMPIIPMWHNGLWSQVNNTVWTNWPADGGVDYYPSTWSGIGELKAFLMYTEIQPAG